MSTATALIQCYLPPTLLRQIAGRSETELRREAVHVSGAVLFADVSGFTGLTERLAARGPIGAEELTSALNRCFGPLINTITNAGGHVVDFAGDALITLFVHAEGPDRAALAAAACAKYLDLEHQAGNDLQLRIGIASGDLIGATLGGENDAWEYLLAGPPIRNAAEAAAAVEPGSIGIDAATWSTIEKSAAGHRTGPTAVVLDRVDDIETLPSQAAIAVELSAARHFVSKEILAQLDAGHIDWLSEFRQVTVAFIRLEGIHLEGDTGLAQAQESVTAAQRIVARYDGRIKQLVADDKGTIMIAAWGMPLSTHEDDAVRTLEACQALTDDLTELGLAPRIGIASGPVFCGNRGNEKRREFALLGNTMNLAARLMQAEGPPILCDEQTARRAEGRWLFEALGRRTFKGKRSTVAVYEPKGRRSDTARSHDQLFGRQRECAILTSHTEALCAHGASGVIVLEGEPGIGKSQLLAFAETEGGRFGARIYRGDADAIEQSTAYFVWRNLFGSIYPGRRGEALQRAVLEDLPDDFPRPRLALLNTLLPMDAEEDPSLTDMDAVVRADLLQDLAVQLLSRTASAQPTVLIFDDAHWFDSSSWTLVRAAARRVSQLLIIIATRPLTDSEIDLSQMLQGIVYQRVIVGALAPEDITDLVSARLGVHSVPDGVEMLIRRRAEGNPFFSEQLAYALRDDGLIVIRDDSCLIADHAGDLSGVSLPTTVQGIITARIDHLAAPEQLTLKIASVIGRLFALQLLSAIRPTTSGGQNLYEHCELLARLDFTQLENPRPYLAYLFKHVITREVAYGLLAFAQRRSLHRAIAEWYEQEHHDRLDRHLPLLAHHWVNADDPDKALRYLDLAAEQALNNHANEEVVQFMRQAMEIQAASNTPISDRLRSIWEWRLGEAIHRLSLYGQSEAHYRSSLRLLGFGAPLRTSTTLLDLSWQLLRQLCHRTAPGFFIGRRQQNAMALLQAAHIHQRLAEVGYWNHDFVTLIHSTVASLNLAELAGESKELQLGYQVMGFTSGLTTLHRVFRYYRQRARSLGARVDHIDTTAFCGELEAIYHNANGNWEQIQTAGNEAAALFTSIGNRFREQTCVILRAYGCLHHGKLQQASTLFDEAFAMVGDEGSVQARVWSVAGLTAVDLYCQGTVALERLNRLESLLRLGVDHSDAIMCHGLLAQGYYRNENLEAALDHAATTAGLVQRLPPASFHTFLGTANAAGIFLDLAEEGKTDHLRRARDAVRGLRRLALTCPIAKPRARLHLGRLESLRGHHVRAKRSWERGLREANRLAMPLEMALLERELGLREQPRASAARRLINSELRFRESGADYEAGLSADLLAASGLTRRDGSPQ